MLSLQSMGSPTKIDLFKENAVCCAMCSAHSRSPLSAGRRSSASSSAGTGKCCSGGRDRCAERPHAI